MACQHVASALIISTSHRMNHTPLNHDA